MEAVWRKTPRSPRPAGGRSAFASTCTRLTLVCLLAVVLWGNAGEAMFAHFDVDGDGVLNMTEAELFMSSVVANPAGLAVSCPNASSMVLARDGDGDLSLNATEAQGMSWDLLQCMHDANVLCSATATVTTPMGSYVCAAEHANEHGEEHDGHEEGEGDHHDGHVEETEEDGELEMGHHEGEAGHDEHEEEEHHDKHGEEEMVMQLSFPGSNRATWHCAHVAHEEDPGELAHEEEHAGEARRSTHAQR
eukprot:jgi/Mesvir1/28578/Mv00993-RA.1